jgi:hypothetical protein
MQSVKHEILVHLILLKSYQFMFLFSRVNGVIFGNSTGVALEYFFFFLMNKSVH